MREPGFWWQKPGLAAWLLSPFALIYGAIARRRMRREGFRAGIPVICVGNFTLGGTGKTPSAIAIAKLLAARGETPFFLTRGYGGSQTGPVRVDPATHRASDVGDEPLLLARSAPTIVSRDRAAGAQFAEKSGASVIVMDDGLQNPSLHKDFSIAVVDGRRGVGNRYVFPAGPLRAPLSAQLTQVHAILTVGTGLAVNELTAIASAHGLPVLRGRLDPRREIASAMEGHRALAFAGIGDPQKFFLTLDELGIEATIRQSFADHHQYSEDDAANILALCKAERLVPVTTEKDIVRLSGHDGARGRLAVAAKAVPVSLALKNVAPLDELLRKALGRP